MDEGFNSGFRFVSVCGWGEEGFVFIPGGDCKVIVTVEVLTCRDCF